MNANEERQALFNISQSIANLRNTLYSNCVISNQSQQQVTLINIQALIERITNETIKQQLIQFINDFGGLLNDCSAQGNVTKQNLINRIQTILLNYYNSIVPIVFTRLVYLRPSFRHHGHHNGNGDNGDNGNGM